MKKRKPLAEAARRTVAFYDANAADFAERTLGRIEVNVGKPIDMSDLYEPFLGAIPEGGAILDAGCGPGRDAAQFVRRGYRVVAFDASIEMVRRCRAVEGVTVKHQTFQEIEDEALFDGVWASPSRTYRR